MLISTKGRYAVRVMLSLAAHGTNEFLTLNAIAEEQGISEKYLESIVANLAKAELVEGVRGKGGGYKLAREPKEYSVLEILSASEGGVSSVSCLEQTPNPCARASVCKTLPVWQKLQSVIDEYLGSVSLEDVLKESRRTCENGVCGGAASGACYDARKK